VDVSNPSKIAVNPSKIALIDMDGTLVDYDAAMEKALAEIACPTEPKDSGDQPWMKARRRLIKKQPGFWRNLPPIPAGFVVLNEIRKVGFEINILTKGPFSTTTAWTEKVEWCRVYLPHVPVTITEDKGLVYGRVLFDDWPPYVVRWLQWRPRGLVVMLRQPWNEGFDHPNVVKVDHRHNLGPDLGSLIPLLEKAYHR